MSATPRHVAPLSVCDLLGDPRFRRTYSCRPVAKETACTNHSPEVPKLKIELLEKRVLITPPTPEKAAALEESNIGLGGPKNMKINCLRSAVRPPKTDQSPNCGIAQETRGFPRQGKFYARKGSHLTDQLEEQYAKDPYIRGQEKKRLAKELGITIHQVRVWFQNRRVKERRNSSYLPKRRIGTMDSELSGHRSESNEPKPKRRRRSRANPTPRTTPKGDSTPEEKKPSSDSGKSNTESIEELSSSQDCDLSTDISLEQEIVDSDPVVSSEDSRRKIVPDIDSEDSEDTKETMDNIIKFIMTDDGDGSDSFTKVTDKEMQSKTSSMVSQLFDSSDDSTPPCRLELPKLISEVMEEEEEEEQKSPPIAKLSSMLSQINVMFPESNSSSRLKPQDLHQPIKTFTSSTANGVSWHRPTSFETASYNEVPVESVSPATSNSDVKTSLNISPLHPLNIYVLDQSLPSNFQQSTDLLMTTNAKSTLSPRTPQVLRPICRYPLRVQPGMNPRMIPINPMQYHQSPLPTNQVNMYSPSVSSPNNIVHSQQFMRPQSVTVSHVLDHRHRFPNVSVVPDSKLRNNSVEGYTVPLSVPNLQTSPTNVHSSLLNSATTPNASPDSSSTANFCSTPLMYPTTPISNAARSHLHQAFTHYNHQRVPEMANPLFSGNIIPQSNPFRGTPLQFQAPQVDTRRFPHFFPLKPGPYHYHQTPGWENSTPLDLSVKKSSTPTTSSASPRTLPNVVTNQQKRSSINSPMSELPKSWNQVGSNNVRIMPSQYHTVMHSTNLRPSVPNTAGYWCCNNYSTPVNMYNFS